MTSAGLLPVTQDPYAHSGEFYDVLSEQQWQLRREPIMNALASAPGGTVLDVGAGTGPCVRVIADALPDAAILAVEPSDTMRAALMCRLMADTDLRRRVTVWPGSLQTLALPETLAAVVMCGVVGYFQEHERRMMWQSWSRRLLPGGVVIADVMMLDEPQEVPSMQVASTDVGDHRYEVWLQGTPRDARTMHWTLTYRLLAGERELRRVTAEHDWLTFGLEQLATEASDAGFRFEPLGDALIPAGIFRLSE